jgi:hypothetical protein
VATATDKQGGRQLRDGGDHLVSAERTSADEEGVTATTDWTPASTDNGAARLGGSSTEGQRLETRTTDQEDKEAASSNQTALHLCPTDPEDVATATDKQGGRQLRDGGDHLVSAERTSADEEGVTATTDWTPASTDFGMARLGGNSSEGQQLDMRTTDQEDKEEINSFPPWPDGFMCVLMAADFER